MTDLFVFSSFLFPFGLLALIVLVVAVSAGRGEPDPTGRRPYAAYLLVMSFIALFTLVFAAFAMVSSVADLATRDSEGSDQIERSQDYFNLEPRPGPRPGVIGEEQLADRLRQLEDEGFEGIDDDADEEDNANIREAVQAALVALAAGLVLSFHAPRAQRLVDEPGFVDGANRRIYQAYLYAVCFVAMLMALGALAAMGYSAFRVVAPGITEAGGDSRKEAVGDLFTAGLLALGAVLVFRYHWARADGVLERTRPLVVEASPPPSPPEPPEPPAGGPRTGL